MGKAPTTRSKGSSAASADDVAPPKVKGGWSKSITTKKNLDHFVKLGMLPAMETGGIRLPGDEEAPEPQAGERVMLVDFVIRGLSLPVHEFLRGLLFVYGVQLHHLTPNGILHVACFITLCECFLGVHPHWGLWKRIFNIKRQLSKHSGEIVVCGGLGIQVRPDVNYFDFQFIDSVRNWRSRWFYIRDHSVDGQEFGLPPYSADAAIKQPSWANVLAAKEVEEANRLLGEVEQLRGKITGVDLISTWVRRRVQPLQARAHPMWEYLGAGDLTRVGPEELTDSQVASHVQLLCKARDDDTCSRQPPVEPFRLGLAPLRSVSCLSWCFVYTNLVHLH
jgi:putative gypsy type transposon